MVRFQPETQLEIATAIAVMLDAELNRKLPWYARCAREGCDSLLKITGTRVFIAGNPPIRCPACHVVAPWSEFRHRPHHPS